MVDEIRRLLAVAGTDERLAMAAFDRLVQLRGRDAVLDALLVLVPGLASESPEEVAP